MAKATAPLPKFFGCQEVVRNFFAVGKFSSKNVKFGNKKPPFGEIYGQN